MRRVRWRLSPIGFTARSTGARNFPSNMGVQATWERTWSGVVDTAASSATMGRMSSSSPSDLAVTFRSIPRRLREAQGDTPPGVTAAITSELDEQLAIAAGLMHTTADPAAIADAIDAVPADEWDEATLAPLRAIALDIGRLLRAIAAPSRRATATTTTSCVRRGRCP